MLRRAAAAREEVGFKREADLEEEVDLEGEAELEEGDLEEAAFEEGVDSEEEANVEWISKTFHVPNSGSPARTVHIEGLVGNSTFNGRTLGSASLFDPPVQSSSVSLGPVIGPRSLYRESGPASSSKVSVFVTFGSSHRVMTSSAPKNISAGSILSSNYMITGTAPYGGNWTYSSDEETTDDEAEQWMMQTRSQEKGKKSEYILLADMEPPRTPPNKDTALLEVPSAPRKSKISYPAPKISKKRSVKEAKMPGAPKKTKEAVKAEKKAMVVDWGKKVVKKGTKSKKGGFVRLDDEDE